MRKCLEGLFLFKPFEPTPQPIACKNELYILLVLSRTDDRHRNACVPEPQFRKYARQRDNNQDSEDQQKGDHKFAEDWLIVNNSISHIRSMSLLNMRSLLYLYFSDWRMSETLTIILVFIL